MIFVFDITPIPKPRMTRQGKKKPSVQRYWDYVNELKWLAKLKRFELGNGLHYLFLLPMPPSWSNKKKALKNGQLHDQVGDLDNLIKGFWDGLAVQDKHLAHIGSAKKIWAYKPGIIISTNY